MALTPRIGAEFMSWQSPDGQDRALGLVDVSIFPHLDHPVLKSNTLAAAEKWAATLSGPAYAIDDIDDTLTRLLNKGAQLVSREVVTYEDVYRLCYIRGPDGLLIGLAQQLRS